MIFILLPGVLIGAVMGLTGAGGGILAVPVLVGSGGVVNSLQVQRSFDFLNFNGGSILSGKLL